MLIGSAGLWLDEHPIPDIFAMLPFELARLLFHDPKAGEAAAHRRASTSPTWRRCSSSWSATRAGWAPPGKILFPIPNRRLSKRLYRLTRADAAGVGREDKLIPPVYGERFAQLIPGARLALIDAAGHMVPYEQPEKTAAEIERFLSAS